MILLTQDTISRARRASVVMLALFIISCTTPLEPTVIQTEAIPGPQNNGNSPITNDNNNAINIIIVVGDPTTPVEDGNGNEVGGTGTPTNPVEGTFCPKDTEILKNCSENSWKNCDCVPDEIWLS